MRGPPAYLPPDRSAAIQSIRKLTELDPAILATGRGKPLLAAFQDAYAGWQVNRTHQQLVCVRNRSNAVSRKGYRLDRCQAGKLPLDKLRPI
jgi:hypothetical protein